MPTTLTQAQMHAGYLAVAAIAEAIKELGTVPAGHLYAAVMGSIDLSTFNRIVGLLARSGLVKNSGEVLTWVGCPEKA